MYHSQDYNRNILKEKSYIIRDGDKTYGKWTVLKEF
jgi:hypothetical protein